MTAIGNLKEPIIEGGIKNPYFFNGRLLTAEDLQDQQSAESLHHRQLGRVMGEGIAQGMEVGIVSNGTGGTTPTVSITPGLAVNRGGQVLELFDTVYLKLVRDNTAVKGGAGVFAPCALANPNPVSTGAGVYILVVAPASDYEGKAPMNYPGDAGKLSGCNHKYQKEGVLFRLVPLDITNASIVGNGIGKEALEVINKNDPAGRSLLRNLLAHLCLGTEPAAGFSVDLFRTAGSTAALQQYGPLDALRSSSCLTDTDVPLALLLWTANGLEFVDMWPVRRKVHNPHVFKNTPYPMTDRRAAELEAAHLHFQEHIKALVKSQGAGAAASIKAVEYFRFLPSVGMIPLYGAQAGKEKNEIKFFEGLTARAPVFIEGIKLRDLIQTSYSHDPIDLEEKELIWLYRVRQNMQKVGQKPTVGGQAYLVFSTGYIPFRGEAQYDLSRYDYSNYSPGVAGYYK